MKSSPLRKSISWLLSQVIQGKGPVAEEVPPGEFTHTLHPQLVSGVYHQSRNTAAFPNTVLLLRETGGVRVSPLADVDTEVFPGPRLSLPHDHRVSRRCSQPAMPPVRHPAAAPSKALACISQAVYRQIFHFSFITPACTVT